MKREILPLALIVSLSACITGSGDQTTDETDARTAQTEMMVDQSTNLLAGMTKEDLKGFEWLNEPLNYGLSDGSIQITTPAGTDFFNDPASGSIAGSAPFLYREIEGDFVVTALVEPDFADVWNAASLMVHKDSSRWIKYAFENSDATGKSVVSVVTREMSDDANGVILNEHDKVWLKMVRKGDIFSMHWSTDGKEYKMARLSKMPDIGMVRVGIEAQCPAGKGATHSILYLSVEHRTVEDLRKGE